MNQVTRRAIQKKIDNAKHQVQLGQGKNEMKALMQLYQQDEKVREIMNDAAMKYYRNKGDTERLAQLQDASNAAVVTGGNNQSGKPILNMSAFVLQGCIAGKVETATDDLDSEVTESKEEELFNENKDEIEKGLEDKREYDEDQDNQKYFDVINEAKEEMAKELDASSDKKDEKKKDLGLEGDGPNIEGPPTTPQGPVG